MTEQDSKLRLAIAVYQDADVLLPTLERLVAKGIAGDRFGLIALEATVKGIAAGIAGHAGNGSLSLARHMLAASERLSGGSASAGATVVASPGLLAMWRLGVRVPALWGENAASQSQPGLSIDLAAWVERGATVLTVEPISIEQQWAATRILLQHSACTVQTLEYSLAPVHRRM